MNKEKWLTKAGETILAEYAKQGYNILGDGVKIYFRSMPPFSKYLGLCVFPSTATKTYFIYIQDSISADFFRDANDILHTLVHEICHVLDDALNKKRSHGKTWKQLMRVFGTSAKAQTEANTIYSVKFLDFAKNILEQLPEYDFVDYKLDIKTQPKRKKVKKITFFKK